jgi:hypothetical protein
VRFPPNACQDTLRRNCSLHLVGCAGHIVHSVVSGARNIDALLTCTGAPGMVSTKIASGHITLNFYFEFGGTYGSRSMFLCV